MVKLHATRLMPNGEVALWSTGQLVWTGVVGAQVSALGSMPSRSLQLAINLPPGAC